jgi:hypothetical protein
MLLLHIGATLPLRPRFTSGPSQPHWQAVVCVLLEAAHNPEFPPPFLTPMYRLGVDERTLRVVELDLCAAHAANDGVLRAAAVAALANPKPERSSSSGGVNSGRISTGSGSGGGSAGIPSTPASATDTPPPQTPPVDGKPTYPSNAGSSASSSSSASAASSATSPFSSPSAQWSMLYFPYIADSAELNWEAPCRVESRDDLVRAHLLAVEATTRVRVPLSVNGYQHHPVVRAANEVQQFPLLSLTVLSVSLALDLYLSLSRYLSLYLSISACF